MLPLCLKKKCLIKIRRLKAYQGLYRLISKKSRTCPNIQFYELALFLLEMVSYHNIFSISVSSQCQTVLAMGFKKNILYDISKGIDTLTGSESYENKATWGYLNGKYIPHSDIMGSKTKWREKLHIGL